MYLFFLTLKTPNGILALCILLYTIILAVVCPILIKKGKTAALLPLCLLPVIAALVHFGIYGTLTFEKVRFLYLESLLPLLLLLPGKSGIWNGVKSVLASVSVFAIGVIFLVDSIGNPMIHNFTGSSYTESFQNMLHTLEHEYCLNRWKEIDYDALRSTYLQRVEEAERDHDETAYAAVITEIAYRFYDGHVSVKMPSALDQDVSASLAGNDYGLSLVGLEDGSVIAVLVDSDEEAVRKDLLLGDAPSALSDLGIHNGTQILSWDGQDIREAVRNVECIYPRGHYPVTDNEDLFRPCFLAGKGGDNVSVTFLDDAGSVQSAVLPKLGSYENRLECACYSLTRQVTEQRNNAAYMLDDKCGYLRVRKESYNEVKDNIASVRKGYYPELTELYAERIEDLKAQGMQYLVIDIRNNGGGYDCCAGALASLFSDEQKHLVSFGYEDANGYHTKETLYIFPDGRYKDLPVAVLVNNSCMSAGDGLAKYLGDCPNVTLMGLTASNGVNQNNGGYIYLTKNICFLYPCFLSLSAENEPLIDTDATRENRIPLDVTIPMTRERALEMFSFDKLLGNAESDPELDYAAAYLRDSEAK